MTNKEAIENHLMAQSNAIRTERKRWSEAARMRFEAICFVATLATCIATILVVRASNARMDDLSPAQVPATTETIRPSLVAPVHPRPQAGALFLNATTYADRYEGRRTASGRIYRHSSNIAASNRHKLGTRVSVTYRGRTVYAIVADRLAKRHSDRIDLSRSLWNALTTNSAPSVARGCTVEEIDK